MAPNNQQPGSKPQTLSWSQPAAPSNSNPGSQKPFVPPKVTTPLLAPATSVQYGRKMLAGAFVIGLVVGVLLGWTWFSADGTAPIAQNTGATAAVADTENSTETPAQPLGTVALPVTGSITVNSPVAGRTVSVSGVKITKPTWITVHEARGNGPGNVLGAKLFFPTSMGGATSGSINLLRATRTGQTYYIGQYIDDGDKKFSTTKDTRVLQGESALVTSFNIK